MCFTYIKECEERNNMFREMNFNRNHRQKVYAKDSMDRFGDDLTELILSYLWFEDKFRLECVSKQWKRCVFQRQSIIIIYSYNSLNGSSKLLKKNKQLYEQRLESVLKKCPNITTVRLGMSGSSEVMSLIGQYCHHIKSLQYHTPIPKLSFFHLYGHKLEELDLLVPDKLDNIISDILQLCPNLKRVWLLNYSCLMDNLELVPNLRQITNCRLAHSLYCREMNKVKLFCNKIRRTQKTLNAKLFYLKPKELKLYIDCISLFENLTQLTLEFDSIENKEPIDDCLSLIGQKCTKLLKLDLEIDDSFSISDRFFDVFTHFKSIKILNLDLWQTRSVKGSVKCFRHCKQLYDIDIQYHGITDQFLANIELFVPKLQSLCITTDKTISDSFIDSFNSMKSIQTVHLSKYDDNSTDCTDKYLYFGKALFEVMSVWQRKDVIRVNDNCGYITY